MLVYIFGWRGVGCGFLGLGSAGRWDGCLSWGGWVFGGWGVGAYARDGYVDTLGRWMCIWDTT